MSESTLVAGVAILWIVVQFALRRNLTIDVRVNVRSRRR
jgi:hypothetical protein